MFLLQSQNIRVRRTSGLQHGARTWCVSPLLFCRYPSRGTALLLRSQQDEGAEILEKTSIVISFLIVTADT